MEDSTFIGLDVHKATISVAVAKEHFVWKRSGVTYAIATESRRRS